MPTGGLIRSILIPPPPGSSGDTAWDLVADVSGDDAAIDNLYGSLGQEWFYVATSGSNPDVINDLETGEISTSR